MKRWKMRRRSLLVGALIILVILVGIHFATDIDVDGYTVGADVGDEDVNGMAPLPSNQRVDTSRVTAPTVLGGASILGSNADIYLDGRTPARRTLAWPDL